MFNFVFCIGNAHRMRAVQLVTQFLEGFATAVGACIPTHSCSKNEEKIDDLKKTETNSLKKKQEQDSRCFDISDSCVKKTFAKVHIYLLLGRNILKVQSVILVQP